LRNSLKRNSPEIFTGEYFETNNVFQISYERVDEKQLVAVVVIEGNIIKNKILNVEEQVDDETLLKMIHAYSTGQFDGNLVEIVDKGFSQFINLPNQQLNGLFAQKENCIKNCQVCEKCKTLYKKIKR